MENQPQQEQFQPEHEQLYFYYDQDDEHDDIKYEIPPGYRFVPDDVELIDDYLRVIVSNPGLDRVYEIYTVDLYGSGPDELTAAHKEQCEGKWYFFTQRNRKYANGNRPDRSAGNGYWKQRNVVKQIFREVNGKEVKIGRKITLDYYVKSDQDGTDDTHTDWKMNEYRMDDEKNSQDSSTAETTAEFDDLCLCRVYKSKSAKIRSNNTQVTLQVAGAPSSKTQSVFPQAHSEHVAGQRDTYFSGQSTEALFSDQHIIAQQQYNGHNAGGPGLNFVQQSTNLQSSSDYFLNLNNSNYMGNATSGLMWMHNNNADLLIYHQDIYPTSGTMHENAGSVQPIRSLASGGVPTGSHSNINQSSLSIPDHVSTYRENDFPCLSFPVDEGSLSDVVKFTFDDFDNV